MEYEQAYSGQMYYPPRLHKFDGYIYYGRKPTDTHQ